MSLTILHQIYDETRRLAIAGSSVAPGDFRLKKLLPSLEQAGAKSPVFAKLAQSTKTLVESNEKSAAVALLELGTLINSILYTQGESGVEGKLESLPSIDFGLARTQTSAKLLKPLIEALTTTGSGRMEVIRSSHEQGLFRDLRLIRPALQALDDSYSEIAEYIAKEVLPIYGPALLPELEAQFNPKGKAGQPRRLLLMHQLDPVRARPHVQAALEEGSKELRVAAIQCLGTSEEDLPFLLEQAKAKARDVREAALTGLARLDHQEAAKILIDQIDAKDLEAATEALRTSESSEVLKVLIERTRSQFDKVLHTKFKNKTDRTKELERSIALLSCLTGRADKASEALHLELVKAVEDLQSAKDDDLLHRFVHNLSVGSAAMKKALCSLHAALNPAQMVNVFQAAVDVWQPDQVFNEFSPYLIAFADAKSKKRSPNEDKGEVIYELLSALQFTVPNRPVHRGLRTYEPSTISNKWLALGAEKNLDGIILNLARLDKKKAWPALSALFDKLIKAKTGSREFWMLHGVTTTMIDIEHPERVDAMISVIKRLSDSTSYYGTWILNKISDLPAKEALPKLEALLPTLKDKIADEVIGHIYVLKHGLTK